MYFSFVIYYPNKFGQRNGIVFGDFIVQVRFFNWLIDFNGL